MKRVILALFSLLLMIACSKDQEQQLYLISSDDATLLFGEDGGEKIVEFYSSADWKVYGYSDWCTVSNEFGSAGNASLKIKVTPNGYSNNPRSLGLPERRCVILIEAGGLSLYINVEQEEQKVAYINKTSYDVTSSSQTLEVVVSTNYDEIQVNIPNNVDWVSYKSTQKENEVATLLFQIEANLLLEERECEIELRIPKGACTIKIKQEANLDLPISFADKIVKVVCVGRYDTNGDGELSYREAMKVKSLPSRFFNEEYAHVVKSFDEFQYFTSVSMIPMSCFSSTSLKSIILPNSVVDLQDNGFYYCVDLEQVKLSSNLKNIRSHAFDGCLKLKAIDLPASLTMLGVAAFQSTLALEKITIPSGVTELDSSTFANSAIKSISLPSTLQKIYDGAFAYCENLEEIHIPNSVKEIGDGIVVGCENLSLFKGDCATEDGKFLVLNGILKGVALKNMSDCTIPDGVLAIGEKAFAKSQKIKHITIPSTVVSIGNYAFAWAVGLNSIRIESEQPPVVGLEIFCESKEEKVPLNKIEVPEASVVQYQLATGWSQYMSIIVGY